MRRLCLLLAVLCLSLTTEPASGAGRTFGNLLGQYRPRPVVVRPQSRHLFFSWRDPRLAGAKFTWEQANYECHRRGLSLVSIESSKKNYYISSVLARDHVPFIWTSGRLGPRGWYWTATQQSFYFTNWSRTGGGGYPQPDNREGKEYCMAVLNHFYPHDGITWHDIGCRHEKPFICE